MKISLTFQPGHENKRLSRKKNLSINSGQIDRYQQVINNFLFDQNL